MECPNFFDGIVFPIQKSTTFVNIILSLNAAVHKLLKVASLFWSDVIETSIEVDIVCNNRFPEIPCNEHTLICHAFLGRNENQTNTFNVLGDVKCTRIEVLVDDADNNQKTIPPVSTGEQSLSMAGKLELSNEALSPEQEKVDFVAVRKQNVPCLGCAYDLNKNAEGVDELLLTALRHIESERNSRHKITNIRKLQQQVVAGVKYILVVDVAQTTCAKDSDQSAICLIDSSEEPLICEVNFIEQPWINKAKHIIKNNCTQSQEFEPYNSGQNDISNDIIPHKEFGNVPVPSAKPEENLEIEPLNNDQSSELRTLYASMPVVDEIEPVVLPLVSKNRDVVNVFSKQKAPKIFIDYEKTKRETKNSSESQESSESSRNSSEEKSETTTKTVLVLERSSKNNNSLEFLRSKRSIGQMEKITPEEKAVVRDLADFAATSLDNMDDDNHKRVILQILGAKKLKLDGIYYQIILRLGISHCHEQEYHDNCREKLFTNQTKICKVQVYVEDDYSNPKLVKSQCQNIKKDAHDRNKTNYSRYKRMTNTNLFHDKHKYKRSVLCAGCPQTASSEKTQEYLKKALSHLDATSKETNKYVSVNVLEATTQVVAGSLTKIKAEISLSNCTKESESEICTQLENSPTKVCTFKIFEQLWRNFSEVSVECDDEPKQIFRNKREIADDSYFRNEEHLNTVESTKFAFNKFLAKYNKEYNDKREYYYRLNVFIQNLAKIDKLNKYEQGTATYGITEFADLTEIEFSQSHGYRSDIRNENDLPFAQAQIPQIELPTEFDWRIKGAVTKVKNQGLCGSCWAFSVTGNVEGQYAIKYGRLLEFSEQELVDCDKTDEGCNGGLMDNAYRAIEKLGGLETESDYPYEGDDETCKFNSTKIATQLSGALNISHNETDMAKWLVQNGPISIAINANAMQFYFGGVSHPWKSLCSPNNLDHGVLIVGYGVHTYQLFNRTLPYWIVKNSWGTSWGEQGYYRVYRGDGTCGLNQTPSSAIVP
ncbi:hypothetical protein ABEB36_009591 [Hypothenemus hampei]|uniref:Cysteine proteinase n=1 Tax=Hypothenemus hampei TaxID=57062 RepID=A0ABD1EGU1_HYPHA